MRTLALTSLTSIAVMFATAVYADALVVDSNTPQFAPSDMLPTNQQIVLSEGERITVVLPSGETRMLAGAFEGTVEQGQPDDNSWMRSRESDTRVLGAIRAPTWDQN